MFDSNKKSNIKIDQTPLKRNVGGFVTHRLKEVSPSRYEFKPIFGAVLEMFYIAFAFMVFFLLIFYVYRKILEIQTPISFNFIENPIMIIPIFIIFIYVADFIKISLSIFKPLVFDKKAGLFWKGFRQPNIIYGGDKNGEIVQLEKIQGLQIIKKDFQRKSVSFVGYELNLVLNNSERMNIVGHGNLKKIREDAQKLGQFLNVPVLDEAR